MSVHHIVRSGLHAPLWRAVAVALVMCACRADAQKNVVLGLKVYVVDQTGACIPGASLLATDTATGASRRVTANTNGQAIVILSPGTFDVTVQAKGFVAWEQKSMRLDADQEWTFTLRVSSYGDPVIVSEDNGPEPEHPTISAEIHAEPIEQFAFAAKPLHHKQHLF